MSCPGSVAHEIVSREQERGGTLEISGWDYRPSAALKDFRRVAARYDKAQGTLESIIERKLWTARATRSAGPLVLRVYRCGFG
jgi:hypothetical protein